MNKQSTKTGKNNRKLLIIALLCIAVAAAVAVILYINNQHREAYLGGTSGSIPAYSIRMGSDVDLVDENAAETGDAATQTAEQVAVFPRGTLVRKSGETVKTDDGSEYILAEVRKIPGAEEEATETEETETEEAETTDSYYFRTDNLFKSEGDIVQEHIIYARTPATIYRNDSGPEIASYAAKGTQLEVVGYDELLTEGSNAGYVNKYKVKYSDAAGESGEGYVYGKYMVGSQAEADAFYNEHGEYDTAAEAEYSFDLGSGTAKDLDYYPVEKKISGDKELCTNARTMYINTDAALNPDAYVELIKETDCNAVVIDIKDGPLTYESEVAKEVSPNSYEKAAGTIEQFRNGVDAYKSTGVYTIGRIVVFNDTRYAKDHPENCIVTGETTNWPSAYSRAVWEYNLRIAVEAVELFGFDEIQFDYVRFPESSYEMSQNSGTDFRDAYGETKGQAVQNFCFYAADVLHEAGAYVSIDVFGECSYRYVTAYGQYWPAISNVVDVVSSMPYSDHHGSEHDTWTNPYNTLHKWAGWTMERQSEIPTPAVDRTWITGYNTPYWNPTVTYNTEKMKEQIQALTDAGLNGGFIPWNVLSDIDKYRQYKDIWNE